MKKEIKILEGLVEELFEKMTIKADFEVSYDKEGETFNVAIKSEDATGLLIGKKGETLSSLQLILAMLLKSKTDVWSRVLVNVGDYREKEEDYLKNLAQNAAERALETGNPQNLYNLKPWQRRVIHMALSENKDIITESEGEELERYLVIKPRK